MLNHPQPSSASKVEITLDAHPIDNLKTKIDGAEARAVYEREFPVGKHSY
jgi:hypothetical protein